ncbi:40S ribosomal protein SA [Tupaia chinensis]|uniref:40S ribosomal protein SA n=1 Tax=Tupaia chinensis TaxID=246437 RepID=L9LCV9_TUPCH|nr:40S ribosomal protein SA [Tupaia chinensis]
MEQYIYKRKSDCVYIINMKRNWEKLLLAAHAIVAIEYPANVSVISSWNTGQRAVLKFAAATGATPNAGRFTPGTFTNQIQAAFWEPCLLVVTDPRADHQPLTERAEEIEKEEQAAAEKAVTKEDYLGEWTAPAPGLTATQSEVADWSAGMQVPSVPIQQFPIEDWSAQPATEDWSAAPTAQATEWVGKTTEWS